MRCTLCNARLEPGSYICPVCGFENDPAALTAGEPSPRGERAPAGVKLARPPREPRGTQTDAGETDGVPMVADSPGAVTYEPGKEDEVLPGKRGEKTSDRPKRRVKPLYIILPVVLVLLVAAALSYFYVLRPLNAPQTRMVTELIQFFDGFEVINGSITNRLDEDHVTTLTVDTGLEIPALGYTTLTARRAKTGENGGFDLKVYAGETQLFTALLTHDDTQLLLSSRLGDKSSPVKMSLPGSPGEPLLARFLGLSDLDVELPEDFVTRTGALFFDCFDTEWFTVEGREAAGFSGEALPFEGVRLTLDAARISEAAKRLTEGLNSDPDYCAQVDGLFGEGTVQAILTGVDELSTLASTVPDVRFELMSLSLEGTGVGMEAEAYIPGVADLTALIYKLDGTDTTEYALTFGGEITGMGQGEAEARVYFTAAGPDLTMDVKYVNHTEGTDALYEADERMTFLLDLSETVPGAYTGRLTREGAALSVGVTIDFNDNATGLLTSMEALAPGAPQASSLPELFAAFVEGLRLDELIPLIA